MARITKAEMAQYTLKGEEGMCFFCPSTAGTFEYTPSSSASDMSKATYGGERTKVPCCIVCWRKIYKANVVEAGASFGVPKGMMTLDQKKSVIGNVVAGMAIIENATMYILGFDPQRIVPKDAMLMDDGVVVWEGVKLYPQEVGYLQGPLAARMMGLNDDFVEYALLGGLAAGGLEPERIDLYRRMLNMNEVVHGDQSS